MAYSKDAEVKPSTNTLTQDLTGCSWGVQGAERRHKESAMKEQSAAIRLLLSVTGRVHVSLFLPCSYTQKRVPCFGSNPVRPHVRPHVRLLLLRLEHEHLARLRLHTCVRLDRIATRTSVGARGHLALSAQHYRGLGLVHRRDCPAIWGCDRETPISRPSLNHLGIWPPRVFSAGAAGLVSGPATKPRAPCCKREAPASPVVAPDSILAARSHSSDLRSISSAIYMLVRIESRYSNCLLNGASLCALCCSCDVRWTSEALSLFSELSSCRLFLTFLFLWPVFIFSRHLLFSPNFSRVLTVVSNFSQPLLRALLAFACFLRSQTSSCSFRLQCIVIDWSVA